MLQRALLRCIERGVEQGAGIIRRVKGARYYDRVKSRTKRRVSALRRIEKKEKQADMERLGLGATHPAAQRTP